MSCARIDDETLGAWLDGELRGDDDARVVEHLHACPDCAARADALRALRASLREEMPPLRAPDLLRRRVESAVRAAAPSAPPAAAQAATALKPTRPATRGWRPRPWLAAAATVLLLVGTAGVASRMGAASERREVLAEELVSAHVRALLPGRLMDVASTDQHTVKPWFAGRLDFSPPVHDLKDHGFPLVGGRVDYVDGHPAAVLVYARRRHWIEVYLWPRGRTAARDGNVSLRGFHVADCAGPAMGCRAVSDLAEPELATFVSLLRASDPVLGGQ